MPIFIFEPQDLLFTTSTSLCGVLYFLLNPKVLLNSFDKSTSISLNSITSIKLLQSNIFSSISSSDSSLKIRIMCKSRISDNIPSTNCSMLFVMKFILDICTFEKNSQSSIINRVSLLISFLKSGLLGSKFIQQTKLGNHEKAAEILKNENITQPGHKPRREKESNMYKGIYS